MSNTAKNNKNNIKGIKSNTSNQTPIEIALQIDEDGMTSLRNLYEFLELSQSQFTRWVNKNVINNPFATENVDYFTLRLDVETPVKGQTKIEYKLTSDFAKQLSMTVKNERGQEARNYFLACEQGLKVANEKIKEFNKTNLSDSLNKIVTILENQDSRITKLEEAQQTQPTLPTYKKPYNPWFKKMSPKYTLLEEYFNITRGQLYRNILNELENLYDIDTSQIQADYLYENNKDSCFPLEPYEYVPKYRDMIESIINSNLIKYKIASKDDPITSTRHITIFDSPIREEIDSEDDNYMDKNINEENIDISNEKDIQEQILRLVD